MKCKNKTKNMYIYFQNEKIPYTITDDGKSVCLNQNKKDYPDEVNQIVYRKFPNVKTIEHNSHYNKRVEN